MEVLMKQMTRIRLINWHYFENETISLHGSTLITGENTAGKSTVLDAIQLVLTTNTRRFNIAANEKSSRSLKGYIRCKTGNIGETYLRKNTVISNVALEFYEEKTGKYFVLGVHMTSPDEESAVITKWYMEDCRFEDLSFIVESKPALSNEFKRKGMPVKLIDQQKLARDYFKRRMGNLEDKFFDIIPKSLAFKPMDNVKDFINKFVLPEDKINIDELRTNIETLSELEELMDKSRRKLEMLTKIIAKYDEIQKKDKDILVNELLISRARIDACNGDIAGKRQEIEKNRQYIDLAQQELKDFSRQISYLSDKLLELNVAVSNNEASRLIEGINRRMEELQNKLQDEKRNQQKLNAFVDDIAKLLNLLNKQHIQIISRDELQCLKDAADIDVKIAIVQRLSSGLEEIIEGFRQEEASIINSLKDLDERISKLRKRLEDLDRRIMTYPENTNKLKSAIEKEFARQGIRSRVYVVAELLEITDERWRNAVEGYFHLQKFNLIVEPEYYNLALTVYHNRKNEIHTVGIVNTRKLKTDDAVDIKSLAYVVHSDNRFAKAYANYILGRVVRVEVIKELEEHDIAITADCMLYQGYVARILDRERYQNPYIGQYAYRIQIENTKKELEEASGERKKLRERKEELADILEAAKKVNIEWMKSVLDAPMLIQRYESQYREAQAELKKAQQDPTLIELMNQIEICKRQKNELEGKKEGLQKEEARLNTNNEQLTKDVEGLIYEMQQEKERHDALSDKHPLESRLAEDKYRQNLRSKSARVIAENFVPLKAKYQKEKEELLYGAGGLRELQESFNYTFDHDFLRGVEGIRDYIEAKNKLEAVELVRFEEELRKAQEECERIFKSDFLSRMKENIENAHNEFRNLNKALKDIYYGEDSYKFVLSCNKQKESLYRMITSDNNMEGFNLWTRAFEEEYKEEMKELFDKLMTKDDRGNQIIEEYTDYRSYLDYDIEIHKKNGSVQKFSVIYGEKSGSETQVPYYVAIAASFYQLYRFGNSVRLMLMDEAFDKMDDDRISSMMDFFRELNLQVILATPPQKVEVIGEKVDTVLTVLRIGTNSIVEEYDM